MTHVIAFDFEAAGGVAPKNAFTQLGAVLMRLEDSTVLSQFNEYSSMIGYEWEERCVKEFWEKFPERYKETKEKVNQTTNGPYQVVDLFLSWVRDATKDMKDVYLITDNSAFDAGLLRAFSDTNDIMYIFGEYRCIIDVNCVYRGMSMLPVTTALLDQTSKTLALNATKLDKPKFTGVSHDHHPVNDAHTMALFWSFIQRHLSQIK